MVKFAKQGASGTPKNNTLLFLRNRLSSCFLLSEPTVNVQHLQMLTRPERNAQIIKD